MRLLLCAALPCLRRAVLLAAGAVLSFAAQSPDTAAASKPAAKQPPPGPLHAIIVKGNHLYPTPGIVKITGLTLGQRVSAPLLEEARKKLDATELFTDIAYEFHTSAGPAPAYDVTYQVTENTQLFPMRFERLGATPDAIRDYLRSHVELYSDRIPGTEGVLQRYTAAVEHFVSQAHPDIKVKAAIANDDPQELAVLFTPGTAAPTISQVFVSGNQAVDTGTLLRAVNRVAVGVPLSDMRLKMILDGTIKPLYAAKGYAAVTFPKVETLPSPTNLGVIVKVEIKDGPAFKFGSIRFRGNGIDEDDIRSSIPFKPGQPFNGEQVDNFRLDLTHKLKRKGLLDASITTETATDDDKRAVNVVYTLAPGGTYNFQKLDVEGLDVTTEPAIEKLWGEKVGQPFNPDYPDFFLKRVQQQGVFDNLSDTRSDYTADASTHNVTVHLYFKGGKSAKQLERDKKDAEDKRHQDGSGNPFPQFAPHA